MFGPLKVARSALPHMRSRGRGTIFFMGSIAGWHGVAGGGAYSASKYALEGSRIGLLIICSYSNINSQER